MCPRSTPAQTAVARSFTAPQSETTSPSKPHSSRSSSVSSQRFSLAYVPLILLYAHITVSGRAPFTIRSNAGR